LMMFCWAASTYAHRSHDLQVFAQELSRAFAHVAEELFAQLLRSGLQRQLEILGGNLLENGLDGRVVHLEQVLEGEEVLAHFFGQVGVLLLHLGEDLLFELSAHVGEDLRRPFHATQLAAEGPAHGFELFLERRGDLLDDLRVHLVELGDAEDHLRPQAFGQVADDLSGLVRVQVHEDDGDGLGVFVAQEVGDGARVEAPELLEDLGPELLPDLFVDLLAAVSVSLEEAFLQEVFRGDGEIRQQFPALDVGLLEDLLHGLGGDVVQAGHLHADALDLFLGQVLVHLCGELLAHGEEEDGGLLRPGEVFGINLTWHGLRPPSGLSGALPRSLRPASV